MSEIPDVWPPEADERPSLTVPVFPLRGVFLLPRQIMPLHIFEPRYRQMIDDVLDGQGRLAMGTIRDGEATGTESDGEPPPRILSIAGLGEIARHEKVPDGRYFIWLYGLGRFDVEEVPSDRMYRKVIARPMEEIALPGDEADPLRGKLLGALADRSDAPLELPDDVPVDLLADALVQKLHLPQSAMEPIFEEPDVSRRARMTLRAHEAFPPPTLE